MAIPEKTVEMIVLANEAARDTSWPAGTLVYCNDTGRSFVLAGGVWKIIGAQAPTDLTGYATDLAAKAATDRKLDAFGTPDDVSTLDASTARHGLLPKLGGGTANFLRADGAWAAPPGGSGGPTTVRKTGSAQTSTDATLANITSLLFALTSGVYYHFKFLLTFRSSSLTVGLKVGATFPAVTRFSCSARIPIAAAAAGGELQGPIVATGGAVVGTAVAAINTDYCAVVEGVILPSANGNLQMQFAAETTGATVTLQPESVGFLYTIA